MLVDALLIINPLIEVNEDAVEVEEEEEDDDELSGPLNMLINKNIANSMTIHLNSVRSGAFLVF